MTIDFGVPVPVAELPPRENRGGRVSAKPALAEWLKNVKPGAVYELASKEADGGHPTSRVASMRELAGDAYVIETRPVVPGKRYRIFVSVKAPATPNGGKPAAK